MIQKENYRFLAVSFIPQEIRQEMKGREHRSCARERKGPKEMAKDELGYQRACVPCSGSYCIALYWSKSAVIA